MKINKTIVSGFSVIELLVVITIVSVLAVSSLPTMLELIKDHKTAELLDEFVSALQLTQSEAVTRGIPVTISPVNKQGNQWKVGWSVFVDLNNNAKIDQGETLIQVYNMSSPELMLTSKDSTFSSNLTFQASGAVKSEMSGSFRICPANHDISKSRSIIVQASGNIIAKVGTLSCP